MRIFTTVFITGANRGLGLEFVRQYSSEATTIYACCRSPEKADDLNRLAHANSNIAVLTLDVTNPQHLAAITQQLSGQSIDLLINNAGIARGRDPERDPLDTTDWLDTFNVNTLSPVKITLALKDIMSRNAPIVANITSKMGSIADNTSGGSIIYRSSKAALNAAIKSLSIDLRHDLTQLLLHPGWVRTDMGGPNGLIDVTTSVSGMKKLIANATTHMNGHFYNYDGTEIDW